MEIFGLICSLFILSSFLTGWLGEKLDEFDYAVIGFIGWLFVCILLLLEISGA